jgi:hypothetical protein
LIINLNLLISQDLINPPKLQRLDTTTAIDRSNNFVKGWNWGSPGRKLDTAMLMNAYHDFPYLSTDTKSNILSMQKPGPWNANISGGRNGNYFFLGQALHLEPTINVDSTDNFRPRVGDINGSVFGFYNRNLTNGGIVSSGLDFSRYKLYPRRINTPVRVLDNAWNGKILRYLDYAKFTLTLHKR